MLRIAVYKDDPRIFHPLSNDPKLPALDNPDDFTIEEIDGIVAERIRRRKGYDWRRDPQALRVVDLTGEENDDWLKALPAGNGELQLVY